MLYPQIKEIQYGFVHFKGFKILNILLVLGTMYVYKIRICVSISPSQYVLGGGEGGKEGVG